MATKKKPSPAQLRAREKFVKMVRARSAAKKKSSVGECTPWAGGNKVINKKTMARKKSKRTGWRHRVAGPARKSTPRSRTNRSRRIGAAGEGKNAIMDIIFMVGGAVAGNMILKTIIPQMMPTANAQTKALIYAGAGIAAVEMTNDRTLNLMGKGLATFGGIAFAQSAGLISGYSPANRGGYVSGFSPANRGGYVSGGMMNSNTAPRVGYVENRFPSVGAVPGEVQQKDSAAEIMKLSAMMGQF